MTASSNTEPTGPLVGRRVSEDNLTKTGSPKPQFAGVLGWTVAGSLVPGLGLWRAGHRIIGGITIGLSVLTVLALGGYLFSKYNPAQPLMSLASALLVSSDVLYAVAAVLLVLALAWAAMITVTHVQLRSVPATVAQKISGALLVGILVFTISGSLAYGANLSYTTGVTLSTVFGDSNNVVVDQADPWKGQERVNILVLGGDADTARDAGLGIRPDSVAVASIDTKTGAAVLINIPRQTAKMPFPKTSPLYQKGHRTLYQEYPNGFYDGKNSSNQEYALNAMYKNVPLHVDNKSLGTTKDFGAEVMKLSVGEALGLDIKYYVMVNMDGFKDIINSIGGVTVNINDRIPVGGYNASPGKPARLPARWIETGPNKKLDGTDALWFARGRYGTTDYKRMERQQCVINAVVKQADPTTVLANYQSLMAAGTKTIRTDVPRDLLPALADLAVKMKSHSIRNVLLSDKLGFSTSDPNWTDVRARVAKATKLADADSSGTASPSAPASGSATASSTASASPSSSATAKVNNLDDACGYHPNTTTKK